MAFLFRGASDARTRVGVPRLATGLAAFSPAVDPPGDSSIQRTGLGVENSPVSAQSFG